MGYLDRSCTAYEYLPSNRKSRREFLYLEDSQRITLETIRRSLGWEQIRANLGGWVALQDQDRRSFKAEIRLTTDNNNRGIRYWFLFGCGTKRRHLHHLRTRLACRRCIGLLCYEQLLPDSRWRREVARLVLRISKR